MGDLNVWLDRVLAWRPRLALVGLCLVLWLPGFFTLPPSDRDESRFAQASKQMIESGDYVRIRNGTVARNQKPIGIYWLQVPFAAAARATGVAAANPIWPYRVPSLIGGIVAVLGCFAAGRRLVGERAGWLGAAFLAGSVILAVETHMAKTDAALAGAVTLAMGVLGRAYLEPGRVTARGAALFWVALAAGVLIKGPIAPMVCGLAVAWLVVADRRQGAPHWLRTLRPWWGVPLLVVLVAPWFVAIGAATHGQFFAQSVGGDLGRKLAGGDDAHGGPPGEHLLLAPLLLWGGGIAAIAAVPGVWRERGQKAVRFLIAWIVPSWVVFELVATKLPHYTLPLYPAVALLAGRFVLADSTARFGWVARAACGVAMVLSLALGVLALGLPFLVSAGLGAGDWLGVPAFAVCMGLAIALRGAWPDPRRCALAMLTAAPLVFGTVIGLELPELGGLWFAPRVAAELRAHFPGGRPPGSFGALGFAEPSLMFLCGTDTALIGRPGDAATFLAGAPARVLLVDDRNQARLDQALAVRHLAAVPFATLAGFNYSNGRRVRLSLITVQRMQ